MAETNYFARIILKRDTEENWLRASSFIPKEGELIVYSADSAGGHECSRIKIGDGVTAVGELPFLTDSLESTIESHLSDDTNPHGVTYSQLGLTTESWTFTLDDGSTVTKAVVIA